jgi:hypothetical protein
MLSTLKTRFLQAVLLLVPLFAGRPLDVDAQSPLLVEGHSVDLFRGEVLAMDFEARQSEYRAWKLLERRKVPSYNAQLGGVIVEFHRHLSKDEHYLVTNCSICRKYLSEIKSYSKKLEQAMK